MDYIYAGHTVSQCSRHFDIPEPTIRYWRKRYNPRYLGSLEDKSKRPKQVRRFDVPLEIKNKVIDLRTGELRGCGKVKIQYGLEAQGITLGRNAIQRIVNEAGLKRVPKGRTNKQRKNRRHMYAVPKDVLKQPGGLVYMDVKHLRLPDGNKIYQFTALDHATRLLGVKLYTRITSTCGADFLNYLQERYPFESIQYVGTDNGSEFLGVLDKQLKEKGIVHVFSSPRSPKQNPYVERVIRTIIDEVYYYEGIEISRERQQEVLDQYVYRYNNRRPHQSLNYQTPMQVYAKLSQANSQTSQIS